MVVPGEINTCCSDKLNSIASEAEVVEIKGENSEIETRNIKKIPDRRLVFFFDTTRGT